MLDLFDIAKYPKADIQVFSGADNSTTSYQKYIVPRGKTMLFIYGINSGGGGGGGFSGIASSNRGGGGGGGSGGCGVLIVPIRQLPDTLYMLIGNNSPGGSAGNAGTNGIVTRVNIAPDDGISNRLFYVANASSGGSGGSSTAGGTG